MLPSLILGTLLSQSAAHNLAWAGQFADQFRAGIFYPRWMADSFEGLGGPAFYFYPPLPFWIDALGAIVPTDPLRLVSFVAPAGHHTYSFERAASPTERWGWALPGLLLILLLVWSTFGWRMKRP